MKALIGDTVFMKKKHPCGCCEFAVLDIGMDYKLQCLKCHRQIVVNRAKAERSIKCIKKEGTKDV